ncbi:mitogen-activated protein kinase kinase kinase 5-like [Juglans microcarpa x Juglans regia]|uniref:mitogen-activated protein kinase kinase kinase 5-like n=1 Tax=Juglans microcarpa x Juglans regia TaxID=2249226 RepID=UPI001B7ED2F4|nr:mitogen-activated protein kinase kinase kinase 5-like [Juglans microcarpa x Juglans regia]
MPFFHKSSPSSLQSSSRSVSADGEFVNTRRQTESFTQRRLTRQRKLRHVSDRDLGWQPGEGSCSSPSESPGSARKSWSPGDSEHWSCSAVPQRLPLPEFPSSWRPESTVNSGQAHLGSPNEGPSSSLGRKNTDNVATTSMKSSSNNHRRLSQDVHVELNNYNLRLNIPARSSLTSELSSSAVSLHRASTDFFPSCSTTSSAKSSNNCCRGLLQELNDEGFNCNFRLKNPARSAPTSVLSSPTRSPRRLNSGDLFPSSVAFQEFQDTLVACTSKESPARAMHSPDQSPLRGPTVQSPQPTPKSPNRSLFPSLHKLMSESHMEGLEISAHPLPLPPGAILPSQPSLQPQSTSINHFTEQLFTSSFKGQWQKGKLIGRGTFGSVFLATNRESGASCAMKEVDLIPDDPKSAECVKQLEQEIKVLRQLKHPNIVQYYGSEIIDDHFYIYLEYVHPGSISKYVHEHCGAITESVVRNFTRHILSGLAYLHSTKTIHRDIKGANLLVDASGVVKLADFGLAKHLAGQSCNLSLKGSPYWMAPEVMQAAMQNNANPDLAFAVDIWSLGCTIIEMLNGKPPWSEFTGPQAMFKVLNRSPPIPETLSSEGKDFLRRCFRRNPAERPTALMLLEHPFIQNLNDQNLSVCLQAFSAIDLIDKRRTVRDGTKRKDLISVSPDRRIKNGNLPCSCGTCQHFSYKISNCTEVFHRPHSMLQVQPRLSTIDFTQSSHSCSPSSDLSRNAPLGAVNHHPFAHLRTHGREISHLLNM